MSSIYIYHRSVKEDELKYFDMIKVGKELSIELKSKGAEIILCLTHNRLKNDMLLSKELFGYVDIILGGKFNLSLNIMHVFI